MPDIPEYYKLIEHIPEDNDETILSCITRLTGKSGNDVRRLMQQNGVRIAVYKDMNESEFITDPNEKASEFRGRSIRVGKKTFINFYRKKETTRRQSMLNYHELRKHYKLYRQERDSVDYAMIFAICTMLAAITVIIAVMIK